MNGSSSDLQDSSLQANEQETKAPPPNRAARRLAQKKELKEKKMAKNTKSTTSRLKPRHKSSKTTTQTRNPKTNNYEFGGVFGAAAMMLFLPLLVILLSYACDREGGYSPFLRGYQALKSFELSHGLEQIKNWNYGSALWYLGIVCQLAIFSTVTPGEEVEGTLLRDGSRLKYKLNALATLQTFILLTVMALRGQGWAIFSWTRTHVGDIALVSIVFSFIISLVVYIKSFFGEPLLSLGGNTGNPIYDFVVGRELNPRIGSFDSKFFTKLRPGLVMWLCLNSCFAVCQWLELGRVTYSMILVNIFQAWYILDALIHESSLLTTMDITTDGFGFLQAFGNMCWVPMISSLQTRYLLDHQVDLNVIFLACSVVFQFSGYYISRSATSERDAFCKNPKDPKVAYLKSMDTRAGKKLIISGWWGKARHINYLGELLMSVAWCLPCGFASVVPYYYCVYVIISVIYRECRDEREGRQKYGNDWNRYCSIVKYRIIPGIY
ncbi:hypothetical protein G6F46_003690 [Rhizopus delemar]|uniref:Delta(14)-sterol reductase n=2 Tax=Rhizopus TaxID=4842 RepID=A0A9P6ZDV3_9FUNG|nr:hypothetical protein G6F55_003115 [Rhizopus delemar]KAG1547370.1 hypothetical protein G6F51_004306 [Rhizopus arrhizus]KAG1496743.1 hypothetical protein G6F54_006257 [Rhizopus delemar]KAG1510430.1 hypothetical protein G6F53_006691 [Rhizopus delemar]KAG1524969.1 hypothetical protein G6F52_003738 [Rhizopus delemar]